MNDDDLAAGARTAMQSRYPASTGVDLLPRLHARDPRHLRLLAIAAAVVVTLAVGVGAYALQSGDGGSPASGPSLSTSTTPSAPPRSSKPPVPSLTSSTWGLSSVTDAAGHLAAASAPVTFAFVGGTAVDDRGDRATLRVTDTHILLGTWIEPRGPSRRLIPRLTRAQATLVHSILSGELGWSTHGGVLTLLKAGVGRLTLHELPEEQPLIPYVLVSGRFVSSGGPAGAHSTALRGPGLVTFSATDGPTHMADVNPDGSWTIIISDGDYRVSGRVATYDDGNQDCTAPAVVEVRQSNIGHVDLVCEFK